MKKYEVLYRIMNYVYHQDRFTLRELMTEFALSKSTALRYIQSLEDIGVPLYSEPGRYGGYRILDSYSIPPVTFTPQETYALFFSMKGMELLGSLPFKAEYDAIQHKFLQSVSPKIKNMLEQIGSRVSFGTAKITNECPQLEKLFQAIMYPSVLRIRYQSPKAVTERRIQPIGLLADRGNWYCPSFDLDKGEYRVFRCDRILQAETLTEEPLPWLQDIDLSNRLDLATRSQSAIDYRIELTGEGKAIFERNHDPRMSLTKTNGDFVLSGWIEPAETPYLLQYLHQFGACLRDIHPASIRDAFVKELEDLRGKLTSSLS
jgi:predicted DNA-binding transcriptional regulator YafY